MKTTNNAHPRKTAATATKTRKPNDSTSTYPVSPITPTRSASKLTAHAHFSRTQLHATIPDASDSTSSNAPYFGLIRKRLRRAFVLDSPSDTETMVLPQISPIEPYLHLCPDSLRRYYKPLSMIARALTVGLSTFMAYASTNWKTKLPAISFVFVRQIATFLFKAISYSLVAQVVLQDVIFPSSRPSRVTMKTLVQKYFLPSSLSKYEPITVAPPCLSSGINATTTESESLLSSSTLGVHYLRYDNDNKNDSKRSFSAMYFQHGFGASSLSWLPVLPKLAKQMNAKVALGHDTVGFGFTDRPKDARWYRSKQSARIAEAILDRESSATTAAAPVCLFGHSMGSRATLRLATQLPVETPKLIVLSSPALGLIAPKPPKEPPSSILAKSAASLSALISRRLFNPSFQYVLRRIIGTNGSWKKGLQGAWGDPDQVNEDSDILRYSWPSIGYGWEKGILKFAGAQVLSADDELDDDYLLMRKVLQLPHTKVLIVLGSRDMVIPTSSVERFMERVASSDDSIEKDQVPIVELEGLGHCAFEEDRETFCNAMEEMVRDNWDSLGY